MANRTSRIVTSDRQRGGGSTGTRVSTGQFGPASPKGGFFEPIYQGAKEIGRYYGYDPEGYYQQRLKGTRRPDIQWRYDLAHYLYGRPTFKSRKSDALPFLPRFPKKKYATPSRKFIQEGYRDSPSKFRSRFRGKRSNYRPRFHNDGSDWRYRWKRSNWKNRKVYRTSSRFGKRNYWYNRNKYMFHVYGKQRRWTRPNYRRW